MTLSDLHVRLPGWVAILPVALVLCAPPPAWAQNDQNQGKKEPQATDAKGEPKKEAPRRDDMAEAAKVLSGPAGNPECVWVGRRVVHRLYQDDLDTAFRHLDLYDRFGCPGGHIQATFRCVVTMGPIDPKPVDPKADASKTIDTLQGRVHSCWVNPAAPPAPAAAATPANGTTTQ